MLSSGGLLRAKIEEELVEINANPNHDDPKVQRARRDVYAFDDNMSKLIPLMKQDPNFGIFDFDSKGKRYRIDIGVISAELEYELFDNIRVSRELPFVVMNLNRKKIPNVKARYLSDDRLFKIYHSADVEMDHAALIEPWSKDIKMNEPYTIRMKILIKEQFSRRTITNKSYANVVYVFGEGMFVEFDVDRGETKIDWVLDILRRHISEFQVRSGGVSSISGSFVVDRLLVNPVLFRGILIQFHNLSGLIPSNNPLSYLSFLWPNEKGQSLGLRKQFRLNFKLGSIRATIHISDKITESSDIFHMNEIPLKFQKGTKYNLVRISDVTDESQAYLVRDIVATVFYLYGLAEITHNAVDTRSHWWAQVLNLLIYGNRNELMGETFGQSKRISTEDIYSMEKNIAKLKAVDPTFYASMATGKPISNESRQPLFLVSTSDPNWRTILANALGSISQDPVGKERQIIRYPIIIQDPSLEGYFQILLSNGFSVSTSDPNWRLVLVNAFASMPQNASRMLNIIQDNTGRNQTPIPITKVEAYFFITDLESPFFQPKVAKQPRGGEGTYHPYLISRAKTQFFYTPGNTIEEKYYYLASLEIPYVVSLTVKPKSSNKSDYKLKTFKVAKEGIFGSVPATVANVLAANFKTRFEILQRQRTGQQSTSGQQPSGQLVSGELPGGEPALSPPDISFDRMGSPLMMDSLLHVILSSSIHRADMKAQYLSVPPDSRSEYLKTVVKPAISNEMGSWNIARQEFFDMEPYQIKNYFLDKETPVNSKLFRSVLEKFFNVYLFIIEHEEFQSTIEVPRHKYLYISPTYNAETVQPMVIFKHLGSESSRSEHPQYELVIMHAKLTPDSLLELYNWSFPELKYLFDRVNRTLDVSFSTIYRINDNTYETGTVVQSNADIKLMLTDIFNKPDSIRYQLIDGAGKTRGIVHPFSYENQMYNITVVCEPMCPVFNVPSFDDPMFVQSGYGADFLQPEDYDRAVAFIRFLMKTHKVTDISYRMEPEDIEYIDEIIEISEEEQIAMERERLRDEKLKKTSVIPKAGTRSGPSGVGSLMPKVTTSMVVPTRPTTGLIGQTAQQVQSQQPNLGPQPVPSANLSVLGQKQTKTTRKVRRAVHRVGHTPLAIGIWFKIRNVQFFIATEPGVPKRRKDGTAFPVIDIPYFEVEPDRVIFKQHDQYEKIMNIMVQLLRNLYIYIKSDDPEEFMQAMTIVDTEHVYIVTGARRRISVFRNFYDDLNSYVELYPSFFTHPAETAPNSGVLPSAFQPGGTYPQLILDSRKTYKGLMQHLKMVQKLKEDIFGASGGLMKVLPARENNGKRQVIYIPNIDDELKDESLGINDYIIENVVRMEQFFNRPGVITDFYVYPSDFTVRGPNQHVFMSEDEVRQYMELLEMETTPAIIAPPILPEYQIIKTPLYFVAKDGSLYILQNVLNKNAKRVINVLRMWDQKRVNLGYHASEWQGVGNPYKEIMVNDLSNFDTDYLYYFVTYKRGEHAALIKLQGSVTTQ